jgi:Xaa-Pro aminopeptidase
MKKAIIWIIIIAFVLSGLTAAVFSQPSAVSPAAAIKVASAAPRFTDAERHAELARRRAAVAAKMADNSMLILFSAQPKLYTNDVDYVYRQENNLVYLTGLKQNGAMLVMSKNAGSVIEFLFLPHRNPFSEIWNGKMYSNEDATRISGIKTILHLPERTAFRNAIREGKTFVRGGEDPLEVPAPKTMYMLLPNGLNDGDGRREYSLESQARDAYFGGTVTNARPIFDELRQVKSPYEIKLLQHAIDITNEAHMRAMAMAGTAKWEYEVQAEVEYTFRRRGADYWGFPSIVGCGPNGTTLHYQVPSGEVTQGDLITLDIGAEYEHYTADVTRTFPVNGKFTREQKEIYQIVYDAQEAVAKMTKPGVRFSALDHEAARVVEDGLFKLGLITVKDGTQFRRWYLHGFGHWLGMNVHDVSNPALPLAPGMIFTNEPGIYIREDALDHLPDTPENQAFIAKIRPAFEKYKNIGVRIEDDLLVTADGVEWMTRDLPRSIDDIEAFMARAPRTLR